MSHIPVCYLPGSELHRLHYRGSAIADNREISLQNPAINLHCTRNLSGNCPNRGALMCRAQEETPWSHKLQVTKVSYCVIDRCHSNYPAPSNLCGPSDSSRMLFTYSPTSPVSGVTEPAFSVDVHSHLVASQHQMSALYQRSGGSGKEKRETPWNSRRLMYAEPVLSPGVSGGPHWQIEAGSCWNEWLCGSPAEQEEDSGVTTACMFQSDLDIEGPLGGIQSHQ